MESNTSNYLDQLVTWDTPQASAVLVQSNIEQIVFYLLAILAIPLAFGVIFDRHVIRSGFMLIGVFAVISGIFLILQAQFLALAQVMIYGVGITLVVVIALMLTNPRLEIDMSPSLPFHTAPAALISLLVFICVYLSLRSAENWPVKTGDPLTVAQNIQKLGQSMITTYSIPFEFASVLLLAALIGAIMLAKAEPVRGDDASDNGQGGKLNSNERADDVVKV